MKTPKTLMAVLLAVLALTWGCATYDSAVPASTGIGAAGGALLGYGLTGSATGAAAGAGAGALAGALTGVAIDESRRAQGVAQPAYPPVASRPSPPPYPSRYPPTVDPTRGELINQTGWRLQVYVDESTEPIWLWPGGTTPLDLDVGSHDILVTAYVDTRFGERTVGSYRRQIEVDPRGSGWSLRFEERMFR
jgi:hypothetical protein